MFISSKTCIVSIAVALFLFLFAHTPIAISGEYNQPHSLTSSGGGSVEGNTYKLRTMIIGQSLPPERMTGTQYTGWINTGYVLADAVGNAPKLEIQTGFNLADIQEDPVANEGTSIADILTSVAGTAISDIDREAEQGLAATGVDNVNGQWQYTIDYGSSWSDLSALSDGNALLLAADEGDTRLRFVPDPDYFGTNTGELVFRAWDQTTGTNGEGGIDTNISGGPGSFSAAQGNIGVSVLSVNDTPTTIGIGDVSVDEDADDTIIDLSSAFADVEDATLSYTILTNSEEALFTSTDLTNGILTLDYAPDANGSSIITIRAMDTGSESVDTSFDVDIASIPDSPVVQIAIGNQTATEDSTFSLNISASFADADRDTLSFSATGLPDSLDINSGTGTISGIPTNDDALASPYSVSVSATDPLSLSDTDTFVLTIVNVNDAPAAIDDNYSTPEDTELIIASPGVLNNDSDVDSISLTAILDSTSGKGSVSLESDGSFTYLPNPDFNGTDIFTYHADDGAAESDTVTVTITVNSVNDPPTAHAGPDQSVEEGEQTQLDGSLSDDPDDNIDTYTWEQIGGHDVTLSDTHITQPTFPAPDVGPNGGDLVFELTVIDTDGASSKDTSIVHVAALDQQPLLTITTEPVPDYAMPGKAFLLSLLGEGQEIDCSDLSFSLVDSSNPPDNMSITREGCNAEIRWVPDADDEESIFPDIQAVVNDTSQSSDPVSFGIEVLQELVIDPDKVVIIRTVENDVPRIVEKAFTISGGEPYSPTPYYQYDLIDAKSAKILASDTIQDDGSGGFAFSFSTENRLEGTYRLKITDGQEFTAVSGLIEIKDIVITPVAQETTETGGTRVTTITDGDYAGTEITIPAGSSDTDFDLNIGTVANAPEISSDAPSGIVLDITPDTDDDVILNEPIEITIPYGHIAGIDQPEDLRVYTFNTQKNLWTPVTDYLVDTGAETITFSIDHFSLYTIAQPEELSTMVVGGTLREDFRMISFPLNPDDPDIATTLQEILGPYDDTVWRFAAYNYSTGQYDEANSDTFSTGHPLEPGKAYWIISSESATPSVKGMSLDESAPYETVLRPGWNMLGNPYKKAIDLSNMSSISISDDGVSFESIAASGLVDNFLFKFDPHDDDQGNTTWYSRITLDPTNTGLSFESMQPYEGYWIFNYSSSDIIIRFEPPYAGIAFNHQQPSLYKKITWLVKRSLHRMVSTIAETSYADERLYRQPPSPPSGTETSNERTVGIQIQGGAGGEGGGGGCFVSTISDDENVDQRRVGSMTTNKNRAACKSVRQRIESKYIERKEVVR